MALLKLCKCGKRIPLGNPRCEECQDKYELSQKDRQKKYDKNVRKSRDKKYSDFYKTGEWVRVRMQALIRDNGLCQHCLKEGRITPADMVHHIVPIKTNWQLRLALSNLISLCNRCHSKIEH